MCGSGTIPLEAALIARRIPPGMARDFGFERLLNHDTTVWNGLREASRTEQLGESPAPIYASDRDAAAVKIAQRTFQGAGVAGDIRLRHSDIFSLEAPADRGVMILNPPYGIRLSQPDELASFYPRLGDWLKQRFAGWRVYMLTGDMRAQKSVGLAPSKKTPLFNGSLECRLYEFKIVDGPMRRKPRLP
jgi:putative N6-adenine-specific DNA methylase